MSKLETVNLPVKYRPKTLADFVGQDAAVTQMLGMLKKGRMPSTLLFMGSPGMGKTTLARILAAYINCSDPDTKTFEPCGKCVNCKMGSGHPDIIEINSADNRGIEEVRALMQQAGNMPTLGSKRIYILDEMQQLTPQAQSCMLKALEEPAPDTVWILASMNPEKLPAATLRRCFKVTLRPVDRDAMAERISKIARREKIDFKKIDNGDKIITAIVDASCGSMSNAVSALEAVVYSVEDGKVDYKRAIAAVFSGAEADQDQVAAQVLCAILSRSDDDFLKAVVPVTAGHRAVLLKIRWLIDHLFMTAIGSAKFTPNSAKLFEAQRSKLRLKVSTGELFRVLGILNDAEQRMNLNLDERATFISVVGRYIVENKK